ncbi:Ig-like domain-containing protein, partial [Pseudomonas sp. 5P_3.1_Bac2]|uniref:Ig-like domain-containing protein n=1 Tax=Pseudomonas sp. 5P_3.1_Bac2 TaxID=2971617 RepID=UPI0021C8EF32
MAVIKLIDKHTGQSQSAVGNEITLQRSEVVMISAGPADIGSINRVGNALVVKLKSGEVITVNDFFVVNDGVKSDLVLDGGSAHDGLWWAEYEEPWEGASLVKIDNVEPLMVPDESWGLMPWLLVGGAAAGGVAVAASSGGGGGGSHGVAPDTVAPDAPTIKFNNKHGLTGMAEANAQVTLHRADGSSVVTQADDKGLWHFNPNPMQEAEEGFVSASDAAGNQSGRTPTGPADVTAPDAPVIALNNANGLSGSSEAGATITLTHADGSTVTTQADGKGQWAFQPNPLQQGENAKLDATDVAGNTGASVETGIADITAPQPPLIEQNNDHGLGGSGEPGGTIVVELPDGSTLTTVVDDNGQWAIEPNPLEDGETGSVTITDPSGNISEPTDTGKADLSAPDAPLLTSNNGAGLTGTAEANSTITLTKADGSTVTTQTDANGKWAMQPNPLAHGSEGTLNAIDASGNSSAPTPTGIADVLAPDAPLVLTNNASSLSGLAEAGSTVILSQADGSTLTTQADANGQWLMQPNPLADQQGGAVTATDASGNVSASTPTGLADLLAPDTPWVDCNNLSGISGSGEAGCLITLTRKDGSTLTTVTDANGHWLITPNPMADCEEGMVTATDRSGNTSADNLTGQADMTPAEPPLINYNNASGLGGTAEAGGTITVTLSDGSTATTKVDHLGNWELQPNPLADGESALITLTDPGRNVSPQIDTGNADLSAPDAPLVLSNNGEGLVGSGEPGSSVVLNLPDGSSMSALVDDQGHWSFVPNPLANGERGSVSLIDPAGNFSTATDTGIADLIAPPAPLVASNNLAGLSGTAEPGSTVSLIRADGSSQTTQVNSNGEWLFKPNPLQHGEDAQVVASDRSGNQSAATATGNADLVAPDAPLVDSNNQLLLGGSAEPGGQIVMRLPDGSSISTQVDENGRWSFEPNPLNEGENARVVVIDPAGNISRASNTGGSDITAPHAPVVDSNNGAGLTGSAEVDSTITLTKPDGSTVTTQTDDRGHWALQPNPLADGEEGTLTATDASDNASGETSTGIADLIAPDAPVIASNNHDGIGGSGEPGATIVIQLPDGSTLTTVVNDNGQWLMQPNPLSEGEQGQVTLVDPAGNISAPIDTGKADVTAPDAPVIDSNNGSGLGGTGEPGGSIVVQLPDGSTVTTSVDENGQWAIKPNPLEDGEQGKVTITDPAGNISAPSETGKADLSAPDAPVVISNNLGGLAGTAEAGSTVSLLREDGSRVTTQADSQGHWLFKPNPLNHGEAGQVSASDASGNVSAQTPTGNADLIAPDMPVVDTNNELVLGGSAEAGGTILVRLPDGSSLTTQVDESGRWSIEPNPLNDGESANVSVSDPAGNSSLPVNTGGSDIIAPDAPTVTSNNAAGISGKAEPDSTVTLTRADGSTVTTQADSQGNWALQPNPLANGEEGQVSATDASGNVSALTPTGPADLIAPDAPVIDSNNDLALSGSAEAGGTIVVRLPDGSTLTTVADDNGKWALRPNPLDNGEQASVTVTDPAGNISAPTVTGEADIDAPPAPSVDSNNLAGLTGTGEAGSTITLTKPDGTTVTTQADADGNWTLQPNPLADGEEATVSATDPSGNVSAQTPTGPADLIAPNAPVIDSNNGSGIHGRAEAGATIVLELPNGSTVTTTVGKDGLWFVQPNPLANGESASVTATDPAGNISAPSDTGIADISAPAGPIVDSNNLGGLTGSGEPGSTITLTKPDGSTVTTLVDTDGHWAMQPNPLADSEQGLVTATDRSGNVSTETATGAADLIVPDAPVVDLNNESGLGGSGEVGGTIVVKLPDGSTLSTVADENGRWSFEPNPLKEGEQGSLTQIDPAGNISTPVLTDNSDVTAPDAPVVENNNESGLGGSGEPGGTIVVELPDGSTLTTVVDDNGQWAIEPNPLEDGESGSVTITDPSGNISEPTDTGKADVTPPAPPVVDNNNESGLGGSGESGGTIVVELPDGSTLTTVVDDNGQWAIEPNPLEDGESGSVTITDPSGNISEPTDTGKADVTPPAPPVVDNNNESGLGGSGEPGGTIVVELPDGSTLTTVVDDNGQWTIEPNPLEDGETGSVTITDPSGNISEPTDTGKADVTPPASPVVDNNNESGLGGRGEPGGTIVVELPDGSTLTTVVDDNGQWAIEPNPLEDGENGSVTVTDPSGNISEPTDTGRADVTPPAPPVVDNNNESGLGGSGEPGGTIVVELPDGSTLTTVVDDNGQWAIEPNPLEDGESGSVTITDPSGNISEPTDTGKADVTPPAPPVVDNNNESGLGGSGEPGGTIVVELPDGSTLTTVVDDNGQWAIEPNPLEDGESGTVTITDPSGNISEPTD